MYTLLKLFIRQRILLELQDFLESSAPDSATAEPVLLNVYGAPELIQRNEFRQPM